MGLETGEFLDDLVPTWPEQGDKRRFGAAHLRLIKQVLLNSFPTINGAVTPTLAEINQLAGFAVAAIDALTLVGESPSDFHDAAQLTGLLANARVQASNVTQHQAALAILAAQVSTPVITEVASFTVDAADAEKIIICDSASEIDITLPGGVFAVGQSFGVIRRGTGVVEFGEGVGQTLNTPNGGISIQVQHGKAVATYIATDTWELSGNV